MVSIVQMILYDSYKIRDIDRSETIELTYKLKNGVLEEIKTAYECPRWTEDIYLEIISRYEYELTNWWYGFWSI